MDRITPEAAGGFRANPFEKSLRKALKLWFSEHPQGLRRRWMIESYFGNNGLYDMLDLYRDRIQNGEKLDLMDENILKNLIEEIISSWGSPKTSE